MTRPPGRDPLLVAGLIDCRTCGAVAYATDAAWIADTVILATYPSPCLHRPAETWTFDPFTMATSRQCIGVRVDGKRCRAYRMRGHLYCRAHLSEVV